MEDLKQIQEFFSKPLGEGTLTPDELASYRDNAMEKLANADIIDKKLDKTRQGDKYIMIMYKEKWDFANPPKTGMYNPETQWVKVFYNDESEIQDLITLKENTFKVGQKVTYLGHPAVVTATKEYNGRNFVSVSYDKGTGKTAAPMILATSGDVKPLEEIMSLDDEAKAYYLAKVKSGEIDTLPENPKAAFLAQMTKDQMGHDKETLRRERGLEEGKQLDQVDFAKVVKAVEQTGHPVTVLLVPKFNEIEVITGMNAPDDMLSDLSNAVDSLGYGYNLIIAGDSSNLSRREYSDIRRVNGGAKDYFEESLNEAKRPEPNYKELVKLLIMAFKHEPKARFYFNRNNGVVYFDLIGGAAYSPKKSKMRDIFGGMNPIAVNREFGRADHHEEETIKQVEQLSKGKIKAEIKELGNGVLYKLAAVNESPINELNTKTYRSAVEKGLERGDEKGREIAQKAIELMGKSLSKELKDVTLVIKPIKIESFHRNYFGGKPPMTGQYQIKFSGEGNLHKPDLNLDTKDITLFVKAKIGKAEEYGGWSSPVELDRYSGWKPITLQLSIRNGSVEVYPYSGGGQVQFTRQGARLIAKIAKEINLSMGGDGDVRHNAIKQFTPHKNEPVKEYNTGLDYHPSKEKYVKKSRNSSLKKVKDMIKRAVKEGDITVDDKTEFKVDLKHLLDKHVVKEASKKEYNALYAKLIDLVTKADNPKNLSIYYNSDWGVVNIGGVGYDKGELDDKFNGRKSGMDYIDIKNVFFKANQNPEQTAKDVNSLNMGVKAEVDYGYGKEPFIKFTKGYSDDFLDQATKTQIDHDKETLRRESGQKMGEALADFEEEDVNYDELYNNYKYKVDEAKPKKGHGEKISKEVFAKLKGKTISYKGADYKVVDSDEAVLTLKDEDGKSKTINLKQFNDSGLIDEIIETVLLGKQLNEELCAKGKAYIKKRKAAGEKSSAYLSGRAVKVCKGQMKG